LKFCDPKEPSRRSSRLGGEIAFVAEPIHLHHVDVAADNLDSLSVIGTATTRPMAPHTFRRTATQSVNGRTIAIARTIEVLSAIAFHEKAGLSQVGSSQALLNKVLFSRRVAAVAMLPSALSRSDFVSLGAYWAFSIGSGARKCLT
jgi:hypothetical protein